MGFHQSHMHSPSTGKHFRELCMIVSSGQRLQKLWTRTGIKSSWNQTLMFLSEQSPEETWSRKPLNHFRVSMVLLTVSPLSPLIISRRPVMYKQTFGLRGLLTPLSDCSSFQLVMNESVVPKNLILVIALSF